MKIKLLLFLIAVIFLFTRLYSIAQVPSSVYWDEASIGVNAYSIAQTGKDEWGKFLPVHFRAFGEFKLPIYIYTTALFVKLLGLSETAVRLPAVLFGLGVVVITYLVTKKLFGVYAAAFAGFFLVISPWFFIFSRTGYEATAGLMFYLLAVYLFLFTAKNVWFLPLSVISFIFSIYSYNSFRIIAPLTISILLVLQFKNFKFVTKRIAGSFVLSFILLVFSVIPIYRLYTLDAGAVRFQTVEVSNTVSIIRNYLSHFSLDFWLKGDKNLRSQQKGFGQTYFLDLLLIPLGLLYIARSKSKYKFLPLMLTLIAPIPAALTKESPHALRSLSAVPSLCIISALGVTYLKKLLPRGYIVELTVLLFFSVLFINYFVNFLDVYPIQSSKDWQYGYKRIFTDYAVELKNFRKVIISDEYAQPYIFALFYLKYDPARYWTGVSRNSVNEWSFSQVAGFDKFSFGKVRKMPKKDLSDTIVFASPNDDLPDLEPTDSIRFLDGSVAFWVYRI